MYNPNNSLGYGFGNNYFGNGLAYGQQPVQQPVMQQEQRIIQVHGEQGAKAYALSPNSSVLLMDQTDNVVWAKVTDGAGYATLKGFKIYPIEDNPVATRTTEESKPRKTSSVKYATKKDLDELKARFDKLEEALNNDESNNEPTGKSKRATK